MKLVSCKRWFMTTSTSAITVLSVRSPRAPSAEAFPPSKESSVLLCPDHLPLHLQAQPECDLPDLADVGRHLIMADEVPVDYHDGGWKETMAVLV